MAADFTLKILGYETKSLFDTGAQVSCNSHSYYKKFSKEPELYSRVQANVRSAYETVM